MILLSVTVTGGLGTMNKRTAVMTLTLQGLETAIRVAVALEDTVIYLPEGNRFRSVVPQEIKTEVLYYSGTLKDILGQVFHRHEEFVMIMAAGIVVRSISSYLASKRDDPAVVVVDNGGKYVVSLLSGHLGGANKLSREVAAILGGQAVITTASESLGLPALDLVAEQMNMGVWPPENMTRVMADLVNGEEVSLLAELSLLEVMERNLPGLKPCPLTAKVEPDKETAGVLVTWRRLPLPGSKWVYWRPKVIAAGIGCRKNTPVGTILFALGRVLKLSGFSRRSLAALASIDIKAGEEGLVSAANRLKLPLMTFTPQRLAACLEQYPHMHTSERVKRQVGVYGVCEPAAVLAAGEGEIIWPKTSFRGVTVALAVGKYPSSALARGGRNS